MLTGPLHHRRGSPRVSYVTIYVDCDAICAGSSSLSGCSLSLTWHSECPPVVFAALDSVLCILIAFVPVNAGRDPRDPKEAGSSPPPGKQETHLVCTIKSRHCNERI